MEKIKSMKNCVIVGAGGFGREVKMLIEQINAKSKEYNVLGFYDDSTPKGTLINGLKVLGSVEDLNQVSEPTTVSIAIGTACTEQVAGVHNCSPSTVGGLSVNSVKGTCAHENLIDSPL